MNTVQLETLTADLDGEFRRDPRGRGVTQLLEEYARGSQDWRDYALFDPAGYTRNLIHRTETFELLLLCWGAGQTSPIHNHMGQCCWMTVLDGEIEEVHFREPKEDHIGPLEQGCTRAYGPGSVAYICDDIALHLVRPQGARPGASLHLYAKPIDQARIYEEQTGKVVVKTMAYDSIRGVRVEV